MTVLNDGFTTLEYIIPIRISCKMNACLFPLDSHQCAMTFVALGYDASLIKLTSLNTHYSQMFQKSNGIWDLKKSSEKGILISLILDPAIPWQVSGITYNLTVTRKPDYYYFTIFAPIFFICLMTLCAVLLPEDSGERVSLLITCFLAQIVFLDQVYKYLPRTSEYHPLVIQYLLAVLFFTGLQIFITSLTSSFASKSAKGKLSERWIFAFRFLGKVLCTDFKKKIHSRLSLRKRSSKQEESRKHNAYGKNIVSVKNVANNNEEELEEKGECNYPDIHIGIDENARDKDDNKDKNESHRVVKILDRLSMAISLIFMIIFPLFFALAYGGKIKYRC